MSEIKYKRVLLKLSGEMLGGQEKRGIDISVLDQISNQIKTLLKEKVEVAVVIGAGNFWRGKSEDEIERTSSDYIGMLATTMNGLALQSRLEKNGISAILQTAIKMEPVTEQYSRRKAVEYLEQGKVVIFGSGTGNPYFTTDTAAALRAAEINANAILVGKTIYEYIQMNPKINPTAVKYDHITYSDILNQDLKVMDLTAILLCKENKIPLVVFALKDPENIIRAVKGEKIGTLIED